MVRWSILSIFGVWGQLGEILVSRVGFLAKIRNEKVVILAPFWGHVSIFLEGIFKVRFFNGFRTYFEWILDRFLTTFKDCVDTYVKIADMRLDR